MKRFVGVFVKYYKASDRGFLGLAKPRLRFGTDRYLG